VARKVGSRNEIIGIRRKGSTIKPVDRGGRADFTRERKKWGGSSCKTLKKKKKPIHLLLIKAVKRSGKKKKGDKNQGMRKN